MKRVCRAMYMTENVTSATERWVHGRSVYLVDVQSGPKGIIEAEEKLAKFLCKPVEWVHQRFCARSITFVP